MQYHITDRVLKLISRERMSGYMTIYAKSKFDDPLHLYKWNMSLAEALYPLLQTVEVALRNSIHEAVKHHSIGWFDPKLIYLVDTNRFRLIYKQATMKNISINTEEEVLT